MAGDWIKMRSDLFTHPKVVRISSALKADTLRTVGGLMSVWCLFDAHSVDGVLDGYRPETLDDHLRWPGFATAMLAVQWLVDDGQSLALPDFDTHNGLSAKRRAQDADRKRSVRNMSASQADKMRTRGEESREELTAKAKATVQPAAAQSRFPEFWAMYPCKKGKAEAAKRWHKDRLDRIADEILDNVRHMKKNDDQWKRGYIPHGSTYLNQARWTDEAQGAPQAGNGQPSKTMGGLLALEAMKNGNRNGLAAHGSHHGSSVPALPFAGSDPGGGGFAGHGDCLDAEFVEVGLAAAPRHPADP